ncbi:MAG: Brp/Blh family beta-carotene 15,15'-dioxygenase [Methylotenera sp.]|nr:Brp/Blh family beta-carotene 15,15'-dioxygenase [Oligoflexia bacterium]
MTLMRVNFQRLELQSFPFLPAVLISAVFTGLAQWALPLLGLLSIGMAHGAVDHEWDPQAKSSPVKFYANYLLQIALFLLLWHWTPFAALLVFMALSAEHFGECEFIHEDRRTLRSARLLRCAAWIWGLCASLFSPLFHWSETLVILEKMGFPSGLSIDSPRLWAATLGTCGLIAAGLQSKNRPKAVVRTLILLLALARLPLLPGFLCFFVFWHAWDSVTHQMQAKGWSIRQYLKKSIPFTVLAWLGVALLASVTLARGERDSLWSILFVSLGALTLSHAQVMKRFYRTRKSPTRPVDESGL